MIGSVNTMSWSIYSRSEAASPKAELFSKFTTGLGNLETDLSVLSFFLFLKKNNNHIWMQQQTAADF